MCLGWGVLCFGDEGEQKGSACSPSSLGATCAACTHRPAAALGAAFPNLFAAALSSLLCCVCVCVCALELGGLCMPAPCLLLRSCMEHLHAGTFTLGRCWTGRRSRPLQTDLLIHAVKVEWAPAQCSVLWPCSAVGHGYGAGGGGYPKQPVLQLFAAEQCLTLLHSASARPLPSAGVQPCCFLPSHLCS